jgi:glycosyltransferase involved in cell wall biosynthesis
MPMARKAHEVERAVRSVLAQDYKDFELLIGDETGAAEGLVDGIGDPRIHYHHNPTRLGFSANHVALLDRARGAYVTVLHDDDRWEPTFLSRLVAVLERHPEVGLACGRVVLDDGSGDGGGWPSPLRPGRNDHVLEMLLREEWFLLLGNVIWRREVWAGPARRWPDLCCGDLQVFLSAADAGWPIYFLDAELMTYSIHRGQSGAWRGSDHGLGVANDVLAFWDGWLRGRPPDQVALTARQRARWYLRQARALLLSGRTSEARRSVAEAVALDVPDLPDLGKMRLAVALPNPVVRGAVGLKRGVSDLAHTVRRR